MKRSGFIAFSLLLLQALFLVQFVAAQAPTNAVARQPLWKIEGKRATVYLLGSIHFLKKEHYPLAAPINAAFNKAKVVAFESDVDGFKTPEAQDKYLAKAKYPTGQTLRNQLSPKLHQELSDYFKAEGYPAERMEEWKPGVLVMEMARHECEKLGLDESLGVDRHFHERAVKEGKTILALDTVEELTDLLTGLTKKQGEAIITETLRQARTAREKIPELIRTWQTGDLKTHAALLNEDIEKSPEVYDIFFADRNRRWAPAIEKLVRGDKDALVIVGVAHLAAKQNLIGMLEKKGLKVTQQ